MSTSHHTRQIAALACAATALLFFATAKADPAHADTTVEAVWKAQRISFEYRGYSTLYTCSSLRRKIETILENVGAREGVILRSYNCNDLSSTARFQIDLESPVEATAQNIADLTTYDAERELVARVRGERLPTAQDVPRFPAVWKEISFSRSRPMRLAAGDCELVQQLSQQILPRMSIQVTSGKVQCSLALGNIGPPRLTVSALVPASADRLVAE